MSGLINRMKEDVRKSGSVQKEIFYVGADQKRRVRFLQELDDGIEIVLHSNYEAGQTILCGESIGESCDCDDYDYDDGWRTKSMYAWSVWDVEEKRVKIFMYAMNQYSPLPQILSFAEDYETIMDRDYVIKVKGKQLDKTVTVVPQDKEKFKNKKAKPYTEEEMIEILKKNYSNDIDDVDDDDDDDEEKDYDEMTPKELYKECKNRGIDAKKGKKEKYYIALLEEYDEDEEDDDDEESEWDEDEE